MERGEHFFDQYLARAILTRQSSVLKINMEIPSGTDYPWEEFLKNNFGEDLLYIKEGIFKLEDLDSKSGLLKDTAHPHSFLALFRFMECLRRNLEEIEIKVPAMEDKLKYFKLLAKQHLDSRQVDRKSLYQEINKTLMSAYNLVSFRAHVEGLFRRLATKINKTIQQSKECNIAQLHGIKTLEKEFAPEYALLIGKVPEILKIQQKIAALEKQQRQFTFPAAN